MLVEHHFSWACAVAFAITAAPRAAAQPPPAPSTIGGPLASSFTIFARGVPIGTEQIGLTRTADGWTIASSGRIGAPADVIARRVQIRYTAEWHPLEFTFDGSVKGQPQAIHTVVEGSAAKSAITIAGQTTEKTDPIDPLAALILPNSFFSSYEAIARQLGSAPPGAELSAYAIGAGAFAVRVGDSTPERIETALRVLDTRRTKITLVFPGRTIDAEVWTDQGSRMLRLSLPAQFVDVVREDIASAAARRVPISRPNDEQIRIPSNGFLLAGTLSKPDRAASQPLPAVVLVGGSGPTDRDSLAFGVPILGQLAGAIADGGFIVLRYDKRGVGQSGGRAESAGLSDYADDLRAALKFLNDRKDVDAKRVGVLGHSEGGLVAILAASKDKRIAAVALVATPGVGGGDLILEQQSHLLSLTTLTDVEKQDRIAMQKKIQEAVVTGKGWEQIPSALRRQAENSEFQSLLTTDPAKIVNDVKQPILIVQGELDTQVAPANADRLAALGQKRKNAPPTDLVKVPGVNHLLVAAKTGEVDEYGALPDKHVSPAVSSAVVTWLQRILRQ